MLDTAKKQKLINMDLDYIPIMKDIISSKYDKINNKVIPPEYPPTEEFILEKDEFYNKEKITTTVGRYLVNRLVYTDTILKFIGYQNTVITSNEYERIDNDITQLLKDDKITVKDFMGYLNRLENFTTNTINIVTNSFTEKILIPNEKVIKRKKELFKQYEKEIAAGDELVGVAIEKELVELAKKELAGDPGLDAYNSGARGSFNSNYKELSIMKGPVFDSTTGKWHIIDDSFEEGISKKNLTVMGNSIPDGAYPKAIGTAVAGHFSKRLMNSLENQVISDKPNSYCGTTKTLEILIPNNIKKEFIGRTIKEGSKDILLTAENIGKYADSVVQLYSPMYCKRVDGNKICQKCGDKSVVAQGTTNIGIGTTRASSTTLKMKMKHFHSATLTVTKIDKKNLFLK